MSPCLWGGATKTAASVRLSIYLQGALPYKGYYNIQHMAAQYKGGVQYHDQYKFPHLNAIAWRTTQDRAPPLTHRRPTRANLYCRVPCICIHMLYTCYMYI